MDVTHDLSPTELNRLAGLLRDSLVSHEAAARARKAGDKAAARVATEAALHLREEAHALDPDHHAPAWAAEQEKTPRGKDTHAEFLAFYRQQLNPEAA